MSARSREADLDDLPATERVGRGGMDPVVRAAFAVVAAHARPEDAATDHLDVSNIDRAELDHAIDAAVRALFSMQRQDGHWRAELEGDSILNSEYLLMKWMLGQEQDDPASMRKIVNGLRRLYRDDIKGWGQFPGSGLDVSATVKGYVCLRLAGDEREAPHMRAIEAAIRRHGGAEACNSFTNFYLAGLGLIDWDAVPSIPPEIVNLPRWFPFHLDHVSAWTRTMILPLAICTATRPVRTLPDAQSIDHLFLNNENRYRLARPWRWRGGGLGPINWNNTFLAIDRLLKRLQRAEAIPTRGRAIEDAVAWMLERADPQHTQGLGAIFPPMVYIQVALHALGYPRRHPARREAERELDAFIIDRGDHIRIEPCFSPVWDTGIALYALTEAGYNAVDQDPGGRISGACRWLRRHENRLAGDWHRTVPAAPAGWYFEYRNEWYPDVDDTAMVAMALRRAGGYENQQAAARGVRWMLAMQNADGGWAAFDKTRDRPFLEAVPFADHNAIQDPSCPDITGRVLECLAWHGYRLGGVGARTDGADGLGHEMDTHGPDADDGVLGLPDQQAVQYALNKAIDFIRARQDRMSGAWFGRWGVNYIYGTWQAVGGLRRLGVNMNQPWVQKAGHWLKAVQKADGSFGESARSYEDPNLKGIGPSTASQTAWAAMALMAIFGPHDAAVARAMRWLMQTQLREPGFEGVDEGAPPDPAGSWCEAEFTGTGFPRVFYLRYHLYRLYFPLMALARYRRALRHADGSPSP